MKVLYIDCFAGIAGDMMVGALLDLGVDEAALRAELATLPLDNWELKVTRGTRHGIVGADVHVVVGGEVEGPGDDSGHSHDHDHDHEHEHDQHHNHGHTHNQAHRSWADIGEVIRSSGLSASPMALALAIYQRLAEAEARLHGVTPEEIHFHEVGAVDAIIDICAVAIGFSLLNVDRVVCAPVPTPRGFVKCAHGVMPLPAPATLELLRGATIQEVDDKGEWVTPTGAAILSELADDFGPLPSMKVERIGYGVGDRDPATRANLLRLVLGEQPETNEPHDLQLEANIDDMSPELFGHLTERLFDAGAVDVWLTPIQMKKGRPGITLSALCAPTAREAVVQVFLRESTTIGLRIARVQRFKTVQSLETLDTAFGPIGIKVARDGDRIVNRAPEYEDCRRAALDQNVPLKHVMQEVLATLQNLSSPDPQKGG